MFHVEGKPVKFQLNNGATWNVIPSSFFGSKRKLYMITRKILTMYNNTMVKPFGQTTSTLKDPNTANLYHVHFVFVK